MALYSTSLINPPPLPPMLDGVEFYVTESESVCHPTPDGKPQQFRACTVLVSFARSDTERAALLPLRHALAFGQTSSAVCDGAEWLQKLPKRLLERLKLVSHDFVTAVIFSGSDGECDAETVGAAADALRQCFGTSLVALSVVSKNTSSHQFARVQGISGFVVGANGTNAETARSVCLCLAMFMAPKTLNGIDLADLLPVLGTADQPAVLVNALWLRGEDGRIVFASSTDELVVRSARRVVAVPLIAESWRWSELRRLSEAIRSYSPEASGQIVFAAEEAVAPGWHSAQIAVMPILCALPEKESRDDSRKPA